MTRVAGIDIALARTVGDAKPKKFQVVFWLKKSVKHRADPETLPNLAELSDALRQRAAAYLTRDLARQARGPATN